VCFGRWQSSSENKNSGNKQAQLNIQYHPTLFNLLMDAQNSKKKKKKVLIILYQKCNILLFL